MRDYRDHLIQAGVSIREALKALDDLAKDAIVFVVDESGRLSGSLTDGDIRRGFIHGVTLEQPVDDIIQQNPHFIRNEEKDINKMIQFREMGFRIVPVLDGDNHVINVINFREQRSYLPVDAVIMAGGKGSRLRPLTEKVPKPLLEVDDKPILEYHLNRLSMFGIDDFWITVNYLGEQIESYFSNGYRNDLNIKFVWEDHPLGSIGGVSKIRNFRHDYVLVTNSDVLTDVDYEKLFVRFTEEGADMAVVVILYTLNVPYGVLEIGNDKITGFKEKPSYTYHTNGGIYLMTREVAESIPENTYFDATDLLEQLLDGGKKVLPFMHTGYWKDVGDREEFEKVRNDISQLSQ